MIPILLYHSVSEKVSPGFQPWCISPIRFKEQMEIIKHNGFHTVTVSGLIDIIHKEHEAAQSKIAVVTFDDGFQDFLSGAMPVLENLNIPATMYVPAGYVGKTSAWLENEGEADRPVLTWEQLSMIQEAGIEVGAHSMTHPQLDTIPLENAWVEVHHPKEVMEQRLGWPIESFAYPHGYYSSQVRQMVKRSGYSSAAAVKNALSDYSDDPFALARVTITADITMDHFANILKGLGVPIAPKRERIQTTMWRTYRRFMHSLHSSPGV